MIEQKRIQAAVWIVLLLAVAKPIVGQAPPSLLLHYEFNLAFEAPPVHIVDLIYRDGLVIETVTDEEEVVTVRRCSAMPADLALLIRSLATNHIGTVLAPPGCLTFSPYPTNASYYSVSLTWFGRPPRRNRLEFMGTSSEICPSEVGLLAADLTAFRAALSCSTTSPVP
jgi:hypothetical protein